MLYIAVMKTVEGYFVKVGKQDYAIIVFESARKGLDHFESAYNRNHARGYEASMSACINNIQYQPSIVAVSDLDDIKKRICPDEPKLVKLCGVSGFLTAITTREGIDKIWEEGVKPNLI
jgi:hypothetical protein